MAKTPAKPKTPAVEAPKEATKAGEGTEAVTPPPVPKAEASKPPKTEKKNGGSEMASHKKFDKFKRSVQP